MCKDIKIHEHVRVHALPFGTSTVHAGCITPLS